ncbi:hypothetical protein GCM10010112_72880 [Actinoplanes lobatus]|uniref:Wadjet protein JetD C-terminal domain-containing protein n=1 Tax=Actinoplanes lobatus TaxID=113568 RepID=A0A7W7MM40_9ACTN|nr:hypothetical protein [Actinoplanes lobatus]MBB4755193.1 hypothetical protein [Actinoplanes lobatus]GGN88940.1 hypothetical protein GCM10010112_72880 [Actinoplanes lobatus]GIE43398.1 hypothetical protein Alo02nite_62960 [Actinoplanes lobatus]
MTSTLTRPAEVNALADALARTGSVRVPLPQVWTLWTTAAPRLIGEAIQAAALEAALRDLESRGLLEMPTTAWDTSTTPPLPRSVTIPAARRALRAKQWIRFPWRHELGWIASLLTLSDARLRELIAVNEWLAHTDGGKTEVVPVRYRSAEIFGDEKCLDGMARTNLFGPGRLSFDLLACVRIPPPIPAVVVGAGPDILVVENSDTYWVAADTLRNSQTHRVGAVAWGCGNAFPSQVAALGVDIGGRGPVTGTVWYWGDLDPAGLTIASDAAAAAAAAGLPDIKPAAALWAAMAERPVQNIGNVDWSAIPGRGWLGEHLWQQTATVRETRGRVAQESIPAHVLASWVQI